jgi:hypothetical protein
MTRRLILSHAVAALLPLLCVVFEAHAGDPVDPQQNRSTDLLQWLSEKREWEDLPIIAAQVGSNNPEIRANAVLAFGAVWDANLALAKPREFDSGLDPSLLQAVITALENHFGVLSTASRKRSLELLSNLRYRVELIPLLLISAADQDLSVREVARIMAVRFFNTRAPGYMAILETVHFLERLNLPARSIAAAERMLDLSGPVARSEAAAWALADLPAEPERAGRVLKALHEDDSPLAKLARQLSNDRFRYRFDLVTLFTALPFGRDLLTERLLPLMNSDDPGLRRLAGTFISANRARYHPLRFVEQSIANGYPVGPDTLEAMELDLTSVCDTLAAIFKSPDTIPIAHVAAAQTVRSIGLHGDAIRGLANSLLEDEDEDVRYIAGELFNRPDIMNRARVPALLKDLRNDSPTRRMTAANQLESLGVEPKEITTALIRAVKQGDMAAREGLLRAIDRAYAARANSLDTLRKLATEPDQHDPTTRAYARAALRAVSAAP